MLVRHGETDWNRQKIYSGSKDIDLNSTGRRQAQKLKQRLKQEKFEKIYSSDLKRARNFSLLALKKDIPEELPELREINFGSFEGFSYKDLMTRYPEIYKNWLNNPLATKIPNGESLIDFSQRVKKALNKILQANSKGLIAVFTHSGPIRIILSDILKIELKDIWELKQNNASISIIEFQDGKGKVISQNDTSYLDPSNETDVAK
jgi:alpha-ribazole phosphatase